MIFSGFEAHVRSGMDDSITGGDDSSATWSTEEIAEYTNDAISSYSQHFPYQQTGTIDVVAGTQAYSLPTDILQPPDTAIVDAVWQKTTYGVVHLDRYEWPPGTDESLSVVGTGKGYWLWGAQLILEDEPSASDATYDITLYYYAHHTYCDPADEDLGNFSFTVPDSDRELLFWYVTSLMMGKLEASDADLRRWAEKQDGGSSRDDSPPRKSSFFRMEQFHEGIAIRKSRKAPTKLRRRRR